MDMDMFLLRLDNLEVSYSSDQICTQACMPTMDALKNSRDIGDFKKCARLLLAHNEALIELIQLVAAEQFSEDRELLDLLSRLERALRYVPEEKHVAILDRALGRV